MYDVDDDDVVPCQIHKEVCQFTASRPATVYVIALVSWRPSKKN